MTRRKRYSGRRQMCYPIKFDSYCSGAFVVLACVGRRVLGAAEGEARWARAALAGAAVAAKRQADRGVAERAAALDEAARVAQRRAKCGVLPFLRDFEALSSNCERIFAGGRRVDLERWYGALARAMLACIARATHPRTPRAVLLLENYHALGGALAALRVPALDAARRECRARYAEALKTYVTQYFGRPLEKLTLFFEVPIVPSIRCQVYLVFVLVITLGACCTRRAWRRPWRWACAKRRCATAPPSASTSSSACSPCTPHMKVH